MSVSELFLSCRHLDTIASYLPTGLLEVSLSLRRHFCRVRRLAWCNDPKSYVGGSVGPSLPDRSKESTQAKRDTLVLQVGGWVDGPAPQHPEKKT